MIEKASKTKQKSILVVIVTVVLFVIGGLLFLNKKELRHITLEEIGTHNSKDSCWTTINGGVYDVTNFIPNHKGGDRILSACGKDATDLFTGKSEAGRLHSRVAIKLLSKMKIGKLQE